MVRTERESDKRRDEKWQTCWCYRDQQRACKMAQASAEKFEHTRPAEKERVASVPLSFSAGSWRAGRHRESSWQVRQSRLCQKKKKQSHQFRAPDREGERVKVSESRILAREGDQSENTESRGWTPQ